MGYQEGTGALTWSFLDGEGNVLGVLDAASNVTWFAYDSDDQEVWRQDPTGATSTMAYDAAARLTGRTDRNGLRTEYLYDDEDRLIGETWKTSGGVTVNVVTYTRDDLGRVTTAVDAVGTLAYNYDEQDRLEAYTNVWGLLLTYTYNDNHDVVKVADWAGGVTTGVYDDAQRLTSRQFGGAGQTPVRIDLEYNDRDDLTGIQRYSDLAATTLVGRTSLTYDDERRLTNLTNRNSGGTTLSSYSYAYDDDDRITDEDWQTTTTTGTLSGSRDYDYDAADQLANDGTSTYTYDLAGNRTMSGYQTGNANRLTTDGLWTYTYDSEGSLTQKSKGASLETWYFAYDHRKRMTSARQTSNGSTNLLLLTYTYDVADNRVQEQRWTSATGTVTTRFAFDRGDVIADLNGSNVIQVRRIYGDGVDEPLARITGGAVVAYLSDRLGSVRDLMDSSGQIQAHIEYDGYGIRTDTNASFADRYGFTGREWQFDVGLQYSRARWYDPRIGRWVSEDPIDFGAGDGNLYRYAENEAPNATDPYGLEENPYRRRSNAWNDWVNPFAPIKALARLNSNIGYRISDALKERGHPNLAAAMEFSSNLGGLTEGLADGLNPNPYSQYKHMTASVEDVVTTYKTARGGGNNVAGSAALTALKKAADATGVSGIDRAINGNDPLTLQKLSPSARATDGFLGTAQLGATAAGISRVTAPNKVPTPTLKGVGKVADKVPDSVPKNWRKLDIEDAIRDYERSIRIRKAEVADYDAVGGGDVWQRKAHLKRIVDEENFVRKMKRKLEDLGGPEQQP